MLQIKEIKRNHIVNEVEAHPSVEFDEYIPFTINFDPQPSSSSLYWRAGDGKLSLIEIGLDKDLGILKNITLTSVSKDRVRRLNDTFSKIQNQCNGTAVFDLTEWERLESRNTFSSRFIDEFELNIQVIVGNDYLSVLIDSEESYIAQLIKLGNVILGVNEQGMLIAIHLVNLCENDILTVEEALL